MLVKIYAFIWLLGLLAVSAFYLMGNFTLFVSIVFGFLSFGAVFMGIMGVLPETVVHRSELKH